MEYKGYKARIRYDKATGEFYGLVADIEDVLVFHGPSILELQVSFRSSIDGYLNFCQYAGLNPDCPAPWRLVVSIDPEVQEKLVNKASTEMLTLDHCVEEILRKELGESSNTP